MGAAQKQKKAEELRVLPRMERIKEEYPSIRPLSVSADNMHLNTESTQQGEVAAKNVSDLSFITMNVQRYLPEGSPSLQSRFAKVLESIG